MKVSAQPGLLSRASAVRYAGGTGKIRIAAENRGSQLKIVVAGKDAGAPEAALEKLFEPFYRSENDRSRPTRGTRLGLAIVKTCIEACRGRVSAENLQPRGFAVDILLKS